MRSLSKCRLAIAVDLNFKVLLPGTGRSRNSNLQAYKTLSSVINIIPPSTAAAVTSSVGVPLGNVSLPKDLKYVLITPEGEEVISSLKQ